MKQWQVCRVLSSITVYVMSMTNVYYYSDIRIITDLVNAVFTKVCVNVSRIFKEISFNISCGFFPYRILNTTEL